ncbi:helix-turn-helix domain-containing protein [Lactiplantibacillus plantarum]|uniref:helix-turn-helix domain-containing protein n=2 Tax=Lactiplantibacillus plantarum TaxID=1590 RepID=UPI0038795FFB
MFTMDTVSIIKKLSSDQGISLKQLALHLGFGENTIYRWNTKKPTIDKLQKVADYFDVSTDYLLGRTDKKRYYELTEKDQRDIGKEVDHMLSGLDSNAEVNYYGEPMTDEDKEKMRVAMVAALQAAQLEARKKFTPKKYRDKD